MVMMHPNAVEAATVLRMLWRRGAFPFLLSEPIPWLLLLGVFKLCSILCRLHVRSTSSGLSNDSHAFRFRRRLPRRTSLFNFSNSCLNSHFFAGAQSFSSDTFDDESYTRKKKSLLLYDMTMHTNILSKLCNKIHHVHGSQPALNDFRYMDCLRSMTLLKAMGVSNALKSNSNLLFLFRQPNDRKIPPMGREFVKEKTGRKKYWQE